MIATTWSDFSCSSRQAGKEIYGIGKTVLKYPVGAVKKVIDAAAKVFTGDIEARCNGLRLMVYSAKAYGRFKGALSSGALSVLEDFNLSIDVVDFLRPLASLKFFVTDEVKKAFKKKNTSLLIANTSLFIGGVTSGFKFLCESGVSALSNVAKKVGNIRFLGALKNPASWSPFINSCFILGLAALAVNSYNTIHSGNYEANCFGIASLVAELAIVTLGAVGAATPIALGLFAAITGLTSFLKDSDEVKEVQ